MCREMVCVCVCARVCACVHACLAEVYSRGCGAVCSEKRMSRVE